MEKNKEISKMNKELKIIINEASFISIKCRNKILRLFSDIFGCNLDISNYKNVDLSICDDLKIIYREDKYNISKDINNIDSFILKYKEFKSRAEDIINKKNVDFVSKKNKNNIINLIIVFGLLIFVVAVIYFCIMAFIRGDYYNLLWFLVFIVPIFLPNLKESLSGRVIQAKNYLKGFFRKK